MSRTVCLILTFYGFVTTCNKLALYEKWTSGPLDKKPFLEVR